MGRMGSREDRHSRFRPISTFSPAKQRQPHLLLREAFHRLRHLATASGALVEFRRKLASTAEPSTAVTARRNAINFELRLAAPDCIQPQIASHSDKRFTWKGVKQRPHTADAMPQAKTGMPQINRTLTISRYLIRIRPDQKAPNPTIPFRGSPIYMRAVLRAGKWSATRERVSSQKIETEKILSATRRPLLGMRFLHDVFGEGFVERRICEPHF